MFENVVVGMDEHQGGRDALALALNLTARGAEITLAHIYSTALARGASVLVDRAAHDRGRQFLSIARETAGIEANLSCVKSSSPGRGLHQVAELRRADLLVVGSTHRGLLGRVLLGDDTRAALNGAPCAVAMAPAGYSLENALMREIGVGYIATRESEHALEVARELAARHGATLSAFEAVSLPAAYVFAGAAASLGEEIPGLVNQARERVAALDGVEPHAAYGRPAEELALYSASLDLLVVGSRDYGPIGRLVHGSTSLELARSARCPLLVLPRLDSLPVRACAGQERGSPDADR